jgi:flagellar biosynthesis GTPase FlhF
MSLEAMDTMPDTSVNEDEGLESTEPQDESEDGLEATEQKVKGKGEQGQVDFIDELKKSGQIPKGVEPFRDDNGELKFIIPINGKKYVANFKQVLGGFNLNQAGEQKLKQGKELEKKFNSILNNISANNPTGKKELKSFLAKLGYDLGDLSESFLQEAIEERSMSPEEREQRKRLAEIEEREEKLKKQEEEHNMTKEQRVVFEKQQSYSNEIVAAMKSKKLDDVNPELKKNLMTGIIGEMLTARKADYNMPADEALDNVLAQYDMLLDNLVHLYSKEHLKKRMPKGFRDLVMKLSLEGEAPITSSSIKSGNLDVDDSTLDKLKSRKIEKKVKKINLSEW